MSDSAPASPLPVSAVAPTPDPAPLPDTLPADDTPLAEPAAAAEPAVEPAATAATAAPEVAVEAGAAGGAEPAVADAVTSPAACGARLQALFPALFAAERPLPLKLRIQADIQTRAPGVFTKPLLSAFLHRYTTGTAYLNALSRATERFDLDGQPAGELSEEHRAAATEEVKRRRTLRDERIAKEREAAREAARAAEREA
ncbi:MAG TPA: ProQ/FinO family protein, partial [Burkholderiaceae bacterium]|nr:ProQ/FinO family protein [Burkholderiaceae bacterium]